MDFVGFDACNPVCSRICFDAKPGRLSLRFASLKHGGCLMLSLAIPFDVDQVTGKSVSSGQKPAAEHFHLVCVDVRQVSFFFLFYYDLGSLV